MMASIWCSSRPASSVHQCTGALVGQQTGMIVPDGTSSLGAPETPAVSVAFPWRLRSRCSEYKITHGPSMKSRFPPSAAEWAHRGSLGQGGQGTAFRVEHLVSNVTGALKVTYGAPGDVAR